MNEEKVEKEGSMVSEKKTKNIKFMKVSELVDFQPVLRIHTDDEDLERIEKSIKENNVLVPIIANIEKKLIIDGFTRLRIAQKLNIEEVPVEIVDSEIDDKKQEILAIDLNLSRRHVDRNTKVALIERLLNMYNEFKKSPSNHLPHEGVAGTIAKVADVSPTTVKKVKILQSNPELLEKVKSNEISLEAAYQEIRAKKEQQKEVFKEMHQREKEEKASQEIEEVDELRDLYRKMKEIIFARMNSIAYSDTATIVLLALQIVETFLKSDSFESMQNADIIKIMQRFEEVIQLWQENKDRFLQEVVH